MNEETKQLEVVSIKPFTADMVNFLLSNSLRLLTDEQMIILYNCLGERINNLKKHKWKEE